MDDGRGELRAEIASASTGRFDAFISYSHRADDDIAPSIRNGLQHLAKPWYRRRAMRVFLDRTNMSADPALWTAITRALDTSKGFVLLMSPESANSPWVNREIEYWVARNGSDRILPVLTSGELVWDAAAGRFDDTRSTAAPPSLAGVYHEEPRYIDLRWANGQPASVLNLRDPRFADAMAEIAAPIREVNKDELVGADLREHRKTIRIARTAVVALCLLLVASLVAAALARSNAERADRRRIDAQASRLRAESDDPTLTPDLGFMLAAEAYRLRPGTSTLAGVIKAAQRAPDLRRYVRAHTATVVGLGFDAAGKTLVSYDKSGVLIATDWATGKTLERSRAEGNGAAVVTTAKGVLVVGLEKAELRDPGTLEVQRTWASGDYPFAGAVVNGSRVLLLRLDGSVAATNLEGSGTNAGANELRWSHVHDTAMYGGGAMPDGSFITIGVTGEIQELVRFKVGAQGNLEVIWQTELRAPVSSISLSSDGSKAILGSTRGVLIFDTTTGNGVTSTSLESSVNALASSTAYPQYVLVANQDGKIDYVEVATGAPYKEQIHEGRATAIAWSSNGRAATGDGDGGIALLDTGPNRLTGARSIGVSAAAVAIRKDGHSALAALADGSLIELGFDLNAVGSKITRQQLATVKNATTVAETDGVVIVGDQAGLLHAVPADGRTWEVDTGTDTSIAQLNSAGGGIVVSRTAGLLLQSWRVESGKFELLRTLSERASAHSTTTGPAGTNLVAYFESSSGVVVANASTGEEVARYLIDRPSAEIALAPDGKMVAVSNGSDVQLFSPGREPRTIRVGGDVAGLAFTDGGKQMIAFDSASGARIVDVATGQPAGYIRDEDGPPMHAYATGTTSNAVVVATTTSGVVVMSFAPTPVLSDGCSFFGRKFTAAEVRRYDLDRTGDPCQMIR